MVKQITARMNYNTLKRLFKAFPSYKNEKMSSYFGRIAKRLEELKQQGVLE